MRIARIGFVALGVAACGDDGGGKKDAAVDAGPVSLVGEYVDWDSTDANFCGILAATVIEHDHPSVTHSTPPNGRLEFTVTTGETRLDITPPTDPSECTTPAGSYATPGIVVLDPAQIAAGSDFSLRSFTTTRRDALFTALGLTYDATKAQVFVNVHGSTAPTIAAAHDAPAAYDGTTWAAGTNGIYVYFPNVDLATATTTLGAQTLPLAADTMTYAETP